ncbi:YggS-like protein [Pontimonas salivibrio]|uniref:Pyridoxal phosphate homeostasis protein n=1 Tax=Pontimonas salivibrio TaxID=1159327 RepID=A0A2L2BQK7_9MICO|nr:YggS family pyridoxal phosphate-dependent enzyme [Pontimonas salivibrio]AVG23953.1 YggS-like protein [Pontimonas salivibrio]
MATESVTDRWRRVSDEIAEASQAVGRDPDDITTVVVTKFHPAPLVRELEAAGVRHVGESRHQEASAKYAELTDLDLTWHFVGQLQSNKARAVADYCSVIHSLDRSSVVAKLATLEHSIDGFIEINLTGDPGRGGVSPDDLGALTEQILSTPTITLRGVMAVAPQGEPPVDAFARVRQLHNTVLALAPSATGLSIGMSGDYREAIAAGATHLRIGTAITGKRPAAT